MCLDGTSTSPCHNKKQVVPDPDWVAVLSLWQPFDQGWSEHIQGLSHNSPAAIWLTDAQQRHKHLHPHDCLRASDCLFCALNSSQTHHTEKLESKNSVSEYGERPD